MELHDLIAMTTREIDPNECIIGKEKTPAGETIIWRRCPICYKEIWDVEGSLASFTAHLSIHKAKLKTR